MLTLEYNLHHIGAIEFYFGDTVFDYGIETPLDS